MMNQGRTYTAIEQALVNIGIEASLVKRFMTELFGSQHDD
jgi:hypothetical protein